MNIVIGQSGGPTPVINMSLCGVVEQALRSHSIDMVYGMKNGITGLISGELIELNSKLHLIQRAAHQPGAILGSSRHSLSDDDLETVLMNMERHGITLFCYIGGNGSSRTVLRLHQLAKQTKRNMSFIHIPKTIDNDLYGTDHTPGFGSAAKFFSHAVQWMGADLKAMNTFDQVKIIESMGRNAGWLAAAGALGKKNDGDPPHLVYLPEHFYSLETILQDVERAYKDYGTVLMIVSENIQTAENHYLLDQDECSGPLFRKAHPGGISHFLARSINEQLGIKARYDAPGTLYRSIGCLTSQIDRKEAYTLGEKAIDYLIQGYSGGMVSLSRCCDSPYLSAVDWVLFRLHCRKGAETACGILGCRKTAADRELCALSFSSIRS
jgi:6-phosphofructokinase